MSASYGSEHDRRRRLMPKPCGQPCPYCWEPMYADQRLHADHVLPRSVGGHNGPLRWAHKRCNERAGGILSTLRNRPKVRSRAW